jgi:altronate hydrolase
MLMAEFIKINAADNVAVAVSDAEAGSVFAEVASLVRIPAGHKMALKDMAEGENVIKYGFPI